MTDETIPQDPTELNRAVRDAWEKNAVWWDEQFGEGNLFQRVLLGPATDRLLDVQPGESVLDVACGNGHYARRMAERGVTVMACDFSDPFLQRARERTSPELAQRITYRHVDATDEAQLLALGAGRYDAAVATMALMDMAEIDPLMRAMRALLKPGGRFVFSVSHPCFNHTGSRLGMEEEYRDGEMQYVRWVRVSSYIHPHAARGIGIIGQPVSQIYFDRPLSELLGAAFRAGLALDGMEEPTFPEPHPSPRSLSWRDYTEIPPVLVVRVRNGVK